MFEAGTKFVVLASTVSGDKTGPKKGSIGFFSSLRGQNGVGPTHVNNGYLAEPASAVFTRYGFEKKKRSELKRFVCIYPVALNSIINGKEATKDGIVKFMKDLEKGSLNANKYSEAWFDAKAPCLVIFPVISSTNLNIGPFSEFKAWFEAASTSGYVANTLAAYYHRITPGKSILIGNKEISKGTLSTIINCNGSKNTRSDWIKMLAVAPPEGINSGEGMVTKESLILSVVYANLMTKRVILNRLIKDLIEGHINGHPFNECIRELPSLVQYPRMLASLKEVLKTVGVGSADKTFEKIDEITSVLGAFSSPLLRRGEEYSYKEKKEVEEFIG